MYAPNQVVELGNVEILTIGLSWDMFDESNKVDLDASCVFFDDYARVVDAVFYNQLDIGYALHSGDDKSGEGEAFGFNETIIVNLGKLKESIQSFMVVINCFSGGTFQYVETANAKVIDNRNNTVLTEVHLGCKGQNTGLILCMFFKEFGRPGWMFKEIGRVCQGRNFKDCEDEMKAELRFLVPEELENEMKWDTSMKKTFDLEKGDELLLQGLQTITMGLGWGKCECDLDASVIEIGTDGRAREKITIGNKKNKTRSIIHLGDSLTGGKGVGDDEQINVHLNLVSRQTCFLVFMVNIFNKDKNFSDVKDAYARLLWRKKKGIVMCILLRNENGWKFRAVGGEVENKVAMAIDAQKFITDEDVRIMERKFGRKIIQQEQEEVGNPDHNRNNPELYQLKCRAEKVDKMDRFGLSDPYFVLKQLKGGKVLYKSEVKKNTLDPNWKLVVLAYDVIFSQYEYLIEVYDWNRIGKDDYIGQFKFNPRYVQGGARFFIVNEKKRKKKKKYKNSGVFVFDKFCAKEDY